jgi:isoleucyl-tRNA synthetase
MRDIDRWILARLNAVIRACAAGYDAYEFHRIYHAVNAFCANDLSAFYLDVIKDRLYCSGSGSAARRSAQTALFRLASTLARLLAPILSHTAEEVWERLGLRSSVPSVQLTDFPSAEGDADAEIEARWEPVHALRDAVNVAVETARQDKLFTNPLEAAVTVRAPRSMLASLEHVAEDLPAILKVSQVRVEPGDAEHPIVAAAPATGRKCARCWLVKPDVGAHPDHPDLCPRCTEVVLSLQGETP